MYTSTVLGKGKMCPGVSFIWGVLFREVPLWLKQGRGFVGTSRDRVQRLLPGHMSTVDFRIGLTLYIICRQPLNFE